MATNNQFKTSNIILNETQIGFDDKFESLGVANHYYQELLNNQPTPTNGSLSVRSLAYKKAQEGNSMSVSGINQQFENISYNKNNMMGDRFAIDSPDFIMAGNPMTRTEHYTTAASIASSCNMLVYDQLATNTHYFVRDVAGSSSYDTLADVETFAEELAISSQNASIILNSRAYNAMAKSINTTNPFDSGLMSLNNRFAVGQYVGQPIISSGTLTSLFYNPDAAATAVADKIGGATLKFVALVSTDSYKSAVITVKQAGTPVQGVKMMPYTKLEFQSTNIVHPRTKLSTRQLLQVVVLPNTAQGAPADASYESNASGEWTITVACGTETTANDGFFGNVLAIPAVDEDIYVFKKHFVSYRIVQPGLFFGTTTLPNISTLDIKNWFQSGQIKQIGAPQTRNIGAANAPINIRTSFDISGLQNAELEMRIDALPVTKAFLRQNIAIIHEVD